MNKNIMKVAISGGFDPIHIGHIRLIKAAAKLGDVVVLLNDDNFLSRKKGFHFMKFRQRKEILLAIKGVIEVVGVTDVDDTVCKTLKKVKPDMFVNGGDRTASDIPEYDICKKLGIKMKFRVGGKKAESSSDLVQRFIIEEPRI